MKPQLKSIFIPLLICFISSCSNSGPKVNHKTALYFYVTIARTNIVDTSETKGFLRTLVNCNNIADANSEGKLDSITLGVFKSSYSSFIATIDSSTDVLNKLSEVDTVINLKHELMVSNIILREGILQIYPVKIKSYTGDTTYYQKAWDGFRFEMAEFEKQSGKLEQLSVQFIQKYKLSESELAQAGL